MCAIVIIFVNFGGIGKAYAQWVSEENWFPDLSELNLTGEEEIQAEVMGRRPLLGGEVPEDIRDRLGATHVAGKYHLTDEPFIIEGAKALHDMGSRVLKLWLSGLQSDYPYNSEWPDRDPASRLVDRAKIPYYQEVFDMDFTTFVLLTQTPRMNWRRGNDTEEEYFQDEEEQMYELAKYLLEAYHDREITFVLQNWEGDWLLRGEGVMWPSGVYHREIEESTNAMIRWFQARQAGVERAREEVSTSKATVAHAIEVNRVLDVLNEIPTLTSHVLPHVKADLVSYSAYDSIFVDMPVSFWHAIEIIKHFAQPSDLYGDNNIYIGEIGKPENAVHRRNYVAPEDFPIWWDKAFAVMFAFDIPYVLHWELYCNVPPPGVSVSPGEVLQEDELRGFWLIKPDGSLGYAGKYIKDLLAD